MPMKKKVSVVPKAAANNPQVACCHRPLKPANTETPHAKKSRVAVTRERFMTLSLVPFLRLQNASQNSHS